MTSARFNPAAEGFAVKPGEFAPLFGVRLVMSVTNRVPGSTSSIGVVWYVPSAFTPVPAAKLLPLAPLRAGW